MNMRVRRRGAVGGLLVVGLLATLAVVSATCPKDENGVTIACGPGSEYLGPPIDSLGIVARASSGGVLRSESDTASISATRDSAGSSVGVGFAPFHPMDGTRFVISVMPSGTDPGPLPYGVTDVRREAGRTGVRVFVRDAAGGAGVQAQLRSHGKTVDSATLSAPGSGALVTRLPAWPKSVRVPATAARSCSYSWALAAPASLSLAVGRKAVTADEVLLVVSGGANAPTAAGACLFRAVHSDSTAITVAGVGQPAAAALHSLTPAAAAK